MMSESHRLHKMSGRNLRRIGKGLLYALLIMCALFMIIPFLWMISTSLKTSQYVLSMPPRFLPQSFNPENYVRLAKIYPIGRMIFNSLFVAILTTVGQIIIGSMAAYVFARIEFKGRNIIFLLYIATLMIPFQVTITPLFILMRYLRWINTYQGLIMPGVFSAFGVFLLRQSLLTLPRDLEEATFIDGGTHFTVYWYVSLPLIKPALATLAVLSFMEAWNNFLWPLFVVRDEKLMTLPVGLATLHGRYLTEWNLVMAGTVITVFPMLIVFLFAQKYFVRGVALSGIKQ